MLSVLWFLGGTLKLIHASVRPSVCLPQNKILQWLMSSEVSMNRAFIFWCDKPYQVTFDLLHSERSIYGLYIKSAPFFGDLNFFPEAKNNSRFYILKLFISLHDSRFSCPVTSLLNISLQSWCILFKIRKNGRFFCWISAYFRLVSIERGRGQDKYFHTWRSYDSFIHP